MNLMNLKTFGIRKQSFPGKDIPFNKFDIKKDYTAEKCVSP